MIRVATLQDRPHFLRLWSQFLEEQRMEGSHVLSNLTNLYQCLDLFEAYALGSLPGGTVFWWPADREPVAAVMGGSPTIPQSWETDLGELATLWGVYVEPDYRGQGIGIKLFSKLREIGLECGFHSVETYVLGENEEGREIALAFGTRPFAQQFIAPLRDPGVMTNEAAQKGLAREVRDGIRSG